MLALLTRHNILKTVALCKPQELEDLLPTRAEAPIVSGDAEEVDLQDYDVSQGSAGGRREAYNDSSDDEGGHHGPGVQCAHQ